MRNIQDVQIYVIFFRRESKSMCCTNCEDVKASFTFYYVSDYCFLFVCLRQGFSPGFLYVAGTVHFSSSLCSLTPERWQLFKFLVIGPVTATFLSPNDKEVACVCYCRCRLGKECNYLEFL